VATAELPPINEVERVRRLGEAARWELARRKALRGDVIDLVLLQWPGIVLDDWQKRELCEFFRPEVRDCFIKGNTGCGKGAFTAIVVCVYFYLHDDATVILTRDSEATARKILLAEVKKWFLRMANRPDAMILTDSIREPGARGEQHFVRVSNPKSGEGFSGVHGPHVLFVFDEATADVLEDRYSLADTQATKFLCLANPRTMAGNFRKAFPLGSVDITQTIPGPFGLRRLVTIGGQDCLNVREKRLEKPVAPTGGIEIGDRLFAAGESIPEEYFEQVKPIIPGQTCYDTWVGLTQNPDPHFVACFAHGRFPDEDPEKRLFSSVWFADHQAFHARFNNVWERMKRRYRPRKILNGYFPVEGAGLDVAASSDGDDSCLTVGGRKGIRKLFTVKFSKTDKLVDWVIETFDDQFGIDITRERIPVAVDVDGVGKGVGDMLTRKGVWVVEIHSGATSEVDPLRYANKRAEAYGEFARRLDLAGDYAGQVFAIPGGKEGDALIEELMAHEKLFVAKDATRFRVTPKSPIPGVKDVISVKQKIGHSPDRSDSVVYFYRALQALPNRNLMEWVDAGAF